MWPPSELFRILNNRSRCKLLYIRSDQSLSRVRLFATLWITARQASLSITNSRSSLKLTSIESVMPSSHLILCCPLLLLPPIPPSIIVFSNESTLHMRWPKYWSFSFSISPSNKYSGLISFRIDWFDLLAVQGTLKSFPAPQFEIIHFSDCSLLYGPNLTSVHEYWKNHSFDYQFRSVQLLSLVQLFATHGLQHTRPPCPSPTPGVYSNSCPSSRWCHPTISSSVIPFSSRLQSFPASGSFLVSRLFAAGGQVLVFRLQHQSFRWIFRIDFL